MIFPSEFPAHIDTSSTGMAAEKKVFEAFAELQKEYDIFFSRTFNEGRPLEIDFIIAIPFRAIIVVEVKADEISYDGTSFWQHKRTYPSSPPKRIEPLEQARQAKKGLERRYKKIAQQCPMDMVLCFPDSAMSKNQQLPPALEGDRLLLSSDFKDKSSLKAALKTIFEGVQARFANRQGCAHKPQIYRSFRDSLTRELLLFPKLNVNAQNNEAIFLKATQEQELVLTGLANNAKILVEGTGGSGKTLLASWISKQGLDEEKKVLFLCYNELLYDYLKKEFQGQNLDLFTFHGFAERWIKALDAAWWSENFEEKQFDNDFWEFEVPDKLDTCLKNHENAPRYDLIVIDEAQDFKDFWLMLIFNLLESQGKLRMFQDKVQNIFLRNSLEREELLRSFTHFTLPYNCRNTLSIIQQLNQFLAPIQHTVNGQSWLPQGDQVYQQFFPSKTEEGAQLKSDIQELLTKHEVRPDQIIILLVKPKCQIRWTCLEGVEKIHNYPLEKYEAGKNHPQALRYATIDRFKGLEADFIFMPDIDNIASQRLKKEDPSSVPAFQARRLYVGASRAKTKLYLYGVR